jgi:hypothetical protein
MCNVLPSHSKLLATTLRHLPFIGFLFASVSVSKHSSWGCGNKASRILVGRTENRDRVIVLLLRVLETPASNLGPESGCILADGFRGFPRPSRQTPG